MWPKKLIELIEIKFPIIQAPMAGGATTPELIAAVSNYGGLGCLAAGYLGPNKIRHAIRKIRELTDKPFAVNLFIPQKYQITHEKMIRACADINKCSQKLNIDIEPINEPFDQPFDEQIDVLIDEKIPVLSFTFGILDSVWVSRLKKNKTILLGTATTLNEANVLKENKVDAIIAQGSEAGGHRGTFLSAEEDALIKLNTLLPQLVTAIDLPIIAAGGIMNGDGIISSIQLGASGVQLGTAFLTSFESGISEAYKKTLLEQKQDNTVLTRAFSGKLARGLQNAFIRCMETKKKNILDYPVQNALTTNLRKHAKEKGNVEFMSLWAGQSVSLCRNTNASQLMHSLINETERSFENEDKINHSFSKAFNLLGYKLTDLKLNSNDFQKFLYSIPDFFIERQNTTANEHEALTIISRVPDERNIQDKILKGIKFNNEIIGFFEIILNFPFEKILFEEPSNIREKLLPLDAKRFTISFLVLNSKFGNKGIGSKILHTIENILKNYNYKFGHLVVNKKNDKAVNFYLKRGYQIIKEERQLIHAQLHSCFIMMKCL